MNARKLGIICALLAAMPNLLAVRVRGARTINSKNRSSERRNVANCRTSSSADQPLTPERGEEIANTMAGAGCTARLPSADAGVSPRFPAQR
jgi:hypothetical protein